MNRIQILGNLGDDPEILVSQAGNEYARISVATNRRVRGDDDEFEDETTWFRVTVFGKWNIAILKLAQKGSRVSVEGRMEFDRAEGDKAGYWPVLIARILNVCQMPPRSGKGAEAEGGRVDRAVRGSKGKSQSRKPEKPITEPDDDLPFSFVPLAPLIPAILGLG